MTIEEIGKIVLQERERCAKIADGEAMTHFPDTQIAHVAHNACKRIATEIRKDTSGVDLAQACRNYLDEAKRLGIRPTEVREYPK